jgi:hypothetical protein
VGNDGPDKEPPPGGPILGPAPIAVSFADPPFSDQLFVEYHALFPFMPLQGHVFTTLWNTERGKPLRTDLYSGGELFRFRTTPSGRILKLPKYNQPPIVAVPYDDGTIALAVTPTEKDFGFVMPYPNRSFTELCRLEDYKGTTHRTCRLTPDGQRLVTKGIDPRTVGTKQPSSVLRVWDISALHPIAAKQMKRLSGAERERLWNVLFEDHPDPETADVLSFSPAKYYLALQAMASLVFHGEDAVGWLRKKMGPPFDLKSAPRFIEELESPEFKTRERANRELERLGHLAQPFLERAMAKDPLPETKKRAEELLDKLKGTAAAYELRQMRIIDVLEHINTPSARELLQQITDGKYDPAFADEAKQALRRALESDEKGK